DLLNQELPDLFDMVWIHPPYWNIIRYSDHPSDLSTCDCYEDYRQKLRVCLRRCSRALEPGGRLVVLIGDIRRCGLYIPIVRDVMNLEPEVGSLRSVVIKAQHNCQSDAKTYPHLEDPRIKHEYCLVFKR